MSYYRRRGRYTRGTDGVLRFADTGKPVVSRGGMGGGYRRTYRSY